MDLKQVRALTRVPALAPPLTGTDGQQMESASAGARVVDAVNAGHLGLERSPFLSPMIPPDRHPRVIRVDCGYDFVSDASVLGWFEFLAAH